MQGLGACFGEKRRSLVSNKVKKKICWMLTINAYRRRPLPNRSRPFSSTSNLWRRADSNSKPLRIRPRCARVTPSAAPSQTLYRSWLYDSTGSSTS